MEILIKTVVIFLSLFVFYQTIALYQKMQKKRINSKKKLSLIFTGFISNVADTLGLGSFAVIVAMNNKLKMIDDKRLPGTLNAHSVLPALLQSILFLNFVEMDIKLLVLFVISACCGGYLSGTVVSRLDKRTIRQLMFFGFLGCATLLFFQQMDLLPIGGFASSLPPHKMAIGAVAMVFAGMLPAIGVGIYVPIQVILFFLGISPLVAFPIMTTTGAIVQATTTSAFIIKKELAIQESLYLCFSGVVGVALAVPVVTYVNLSTLRWLLLIIVSYNAVMLWKTNLKEKAELLQT